MRQDIDVVLIGAGGLAKEIIGYLRGCGTYRPVCALADMGAPGELLGVPVVDPARYDGDVRRAIIAVGEPLSRTIVLEKWRAMGFEWQTYRHPSAIVSPDAVIGTGCVLTPCTVVAGNARVDDYCMFNIHSALGHDSHVGAFSSLMPGAIVAGGAVLGREVMAGMGSRVVPGVTIGDRCRIAAGAIVYRNYPADQLLAGAPAQASPDVFHMRRRAKLGIPR